MLRNAIVLSIVGLFGAGNAYGGALSLDGSDDHVTLNPASEVFPTGDDSYTIEVWFKADDDDNGNLFYMGDNWYRQANGIKLKDDGGNTALENWNWEQDYHEDAGSNLTGAWHHFAAVYDNGGGGAGTGSKKIYLDGSQLGSGKTGITNDLNVQDSNHVIGAVPTYGQYFDGLIDELRIWDVARSASAISADWDRALLGTEAGLVAYYQFTDLTDSAGSAHGTAHNGASISLGDNAPVEPFTLYSDGGGNWYEAGTWDPEWVPTADIDIVVDGGDLVTVTGGADLGKSLSITASSTVEVDGSLVIGSGGVSVDAGSTLDVDGTLTATGGVSVTDGVLTGDGTIDANVAVDWHLSPGSSIGTLDVTGNLLMKAGSRYDWEVGDGTLDLVAVTGDLALSSDNWGLKIIDSDGLGGARAPGDYLLFTYGGSINFAEPWINIDDAGDLGWTADMLSVINVPGDSGSVYLHVIPEPNMAALLVSGLLTLLLFARRRRKR